MSFNCSLGTDTCDRDLTLTNHSITFWLAGHIVDTINMFANATAYLLSDPNCKVTASTDARACVKGPQLLAELKKTRQSGYTGWLELDSNGDRLGVYILSQLRPAASVEQQADGLAYDDVRVATYNTQSGYMSKLRNLSWVHHSASSDPGSLESRCSQPCDAGKARIVLEVKCCWLCQSCRSNERLAEAGTRCEDCPLFTWPDPATNRTTCRDIEVDVPEWNSARGIVQITLALGCLFCCKAVVLFVCRHWNCRVIKACSRELSLLMLLAICLGYVAMVTLLAWPTEVSCRANYLLFCLSFALIYGPLLVRALRIYRIFNASQRSVRRPSMVSSGHQFFFSTGLVLVQVS